MYLLPYRPRLRIHPFPFDLGYVGDRGLFGLLVITDEAGDAINGCMEVRKQGSKVSQTGLDRFQLAGWVSNEYAIVQIRNIYKVIRAHGRLRIVPDPNQTEQENTASKAAVRREHSLLSHHRRPSRAA